MELFMRISVQQ